MSILNNNSVNNATDGYNKTFIRSMTKYNKRQEKANLKKICVGALRDYNNHFKYAIVNAYQNIIELDDENRWNAMPPKYKEMVVGYLIYNNNIIPYTEASSITTIHNVLLNDVRFNFAGSDDDLNFQYIISFLASVGVVVPRDDNGEPLFEVVSLFNGSTSKEDIESYTSLTHFIHYRGHPSGMYRNIENYGFDFKTDNIIRKDNPRDYNANRIKLTLKLVGEVLARKTRNDTSDISEYIVS
mgnify:CR=1 FL=1|jgi:hypothetical protein|tara:strand:+ start:275 stop:1000 length:726 start_codon:yes stop_codon:yes gene_type:complete